VPETTDLEEFARFHQPALEADEVRHNLILGLLGGKSGAEFRIWTLGRPGACAAQSPGWNLVLGALTEHECHQLADATSGENIPGVVGCDETGVWFVDRATKLGHAFLPPIPQHIHVLDHAPRYPGAPGHARPVAEADAGLFVEWAQAFSAEATPDDPKPAREQLERRIAERRDFFWIVDGQPVAMAGIARRTRHTAAISLVYTPPSLRGRGYAGSVTAAVVERILAEGKRSACLYTDLRNPASNRCYAKIGFSPVCSAYHYVRSA
jgi:RimJ/RimL family protein N-acetyltransferase